MARRPDDLALLALIEQPLDPAAVAAQLAALDEDLRVEVGQMRRDRELLSGLAAPELPCDFVAGLAGMMEPPAPVVPGTGRRGAMVRLVNDWMGSRSFVRTAGGLSLAACGGAALATVVWITLSRGAPDAGSGPDAARDGTALAHASGLEQPTAESTPSSGRTPEPRFYAADAELHHPLPPGVGSGTLLADGGRSGRHGLPPDASAADGVESREGLAKGAIAIVIRTDRSATSTSQGVDALRRALEASSPKDAALVRNVTYSEAGDLEMRVRAAGRSDGHSSPAMASGDPGSVRSVPDRPRVVVDPTLADAALGEHLAGSRSAAAAPELQLALADDGFTHSVTIPVERLRDLVMALAFDETVRMQIGRRETMAPDRLGAVRDPASSAWQRWKDATAVLDELERSLPRGSLVVVAARVQPGSK